VIQAGHEVQLERCAFTATGGGGGSRAVESEGGTLVATGCWFEGFDRALDISVIAGRTVTLTQCMLIRAKGDRGWAVRVDRMPGGDPLKHPPRVVIDRCTVKAKGLLDLVGFSAQAPVSVELRGCAVQADAVLAWQRYGEAPLPSEVLRWSGANNRYDVRGKSWVVAGPDGAPPPSGGPADFAAWNRKFTDRGSDAAPVKFQAEPSAPSESLVPQDFALTEPGDPPAGADPDQVGPPAKQ
jgi:serine/threonine-protein kinase